MKSKTSRISAGVLFDFVLKAILEFAVVDDIVTQPAKDLPFRHQYHTRTHFIIDCLARCR